VWAYSTRYYEPDVIEQENVPRFPEKALRDIFCLPGQQLVKPLETRHMTERELSTTGLVRHYEMQSAVFSPTDLGIPSSRGRQYAVIVLHPIAKLDSRMSFESLFFRHRHLDASVYMQAIPDAVWKAELIDSAYKLARVAGMAMGNFVCDSLPEEPARSKCTSERALSFRNG
jgi:hypothetical protein